MDKRMCYFVMETVTDENGNYIPCIAVEGERGYHKTDWQWGKDLELASACADDMNEKMGISKRDAMMIQLSTMCQS